MPLRLSTGLVNKLMDTASFKATFALSFLDIYSGAQPADANDAAVGTKLAAITNNSTATGLTFEASATLGELEKTAAEVWSGLGLAAGTAGWFRLREATDSGVALSTTASRVDGSIATSGAQLNLGSLTIAVGAPVVISSAAFTLPKS